MAAISTYVSAVLPLLIGGIVIGLSLEFGFGVGVIVGIFFILGDIFFVLLIFSKWDSLPPRRP
jgi:hypothetical protein